MIRDTIEVIKTLREAGIAIDQAKKLNPELISKVKLAISDCQVELMARDQEIDRLKNLQQKYTIKEQSNVHVWFNEIEGKFCTMCWFNDNKINGTVAKSVGMRWQYTCSSGHKTEAQHKVKD